MTDEPAIPGRFSPDRFGMMHVAAQVQVADSRGFPAVDMALQPATLKPGRGKRWAWPTGDLLLGMVLRSIVYLQLQFF